MPIPISSPFLSRCRRSSGVRWLMLFLFTLSYGLGLPSSWANPTGENVVAGSATFDANGSILTVTNSNGAIIHWQDFSIASGELTKFVQPDASSSVLNRVVGSNLSAIYGTLQSNGQVILINPNGIVFGAGGVVDCAGFVASTLNITNEQFQAGGTLKFMSQGESGTITNLGNISASGSNVMLISKQITNAGTIVAPQGTAGLYASDAVELYLSESGSTQGLVRVSNEPASGSGTGIENSGTIEAARAELKATGNIYALAINNTGTVRATGTQTINGVVHFSGKGGTVQNSGQISAVTAQQNGGKIKIEADNIALHNGTVLDASGINGGEILVGGDYQGKNPEVYNAQKVFVESGVSIKADGGSTNSAFPISNFALSSGNGGKVIIWSDDTTLFHGHISARGGDEAGHGGFAEVSGKQNIQMTGFADLRAPLGDYGSLLIDPGSVNITPGGNTFVSNNVFYDGYISAQLGLGNMTITTSSATGGSETISIDGFINWSANTTLSLIAGKNIQFTTTSSIQNTGGGSIVFTANGIGGPTYGVDLGDSVLQTNTGNITITASGGYGFVMTDGQVGSNSGTISITGTSTAGGAAGIEISTAGFFPSIQSTSGNIVLTGQNTYSGSGTGAMGIKFNNTGTVTTGGAGSITMVGTGGNATGGQNSGIQLQNTNVTIGNGALTIQGAGGAGTSSNGVYLISSNITTGNGSVSLQGTGGTGGSSYGTVLASSSRIISGNGSVSLQGTGGGGTGSHGTYIVSSSNITTGNGTITLQGTGGSGGSGFGTYLNSSSITSGNGAISLQGTGGTGGSTNYGVVLVTGNITTGNGSVSLQGTGGNGTDSNIGAYINSNTLVNITGSGALNVTGTGGGTGNYNHGVAIANGSQLLTTTGNITLVGTAVGSGVDCTGLTMIATSKIKTTTGNITVDVGGSGSNLYGLAMSYGDGTTTEISTTGGNILITGRDTSRIYLHNGPLISAGGAGALTISNFTTSDLNAANILTSNGNLTFSVGTVSLIFGTSIRSTGSGDVTIVATNATNSVGISTNTSSSFSVGSGNLTLIADNASIAGNISTTGAGNLLIRPLTNSTTIGLGTGGNGTLNLDASELSSIVSGFNQVQFGSAAQTGALDYNFLTLNNPTRFVTSTADINGDNGGSITVNTGASLGIQTAANATLIFQSNATLGNITANNAWLGLSASNIAISQGANTSLTVSGLRLDAGVGTTWDMSRATNDLGTLVIASGGGANSNVTVADSNGFVIGTISGLGSGINMVNGGTLTFNSAGNVTQTSSIVVPSLRLLGTANYTLTNTGNNLSTLAANLTGSGSMNFVGTNTTALTIGSVGGTSGLTTASGAIAVSAAKGLIVNNTVTSGTGEITLVGNNTGSGSANGLVLNAGITTGGGNITLIGSGSNGVGTDANGIYFNGINVSTSGTGSIAITGTGGNITSANTHAIGVWFNGGNITAVNGNVTINGYAGDNPNDGTANLTGIYLNGLIANVTGTGSLTVNGFGGTGTNPLANGVTGVQMYAGSLETNSGTLTLTGTGSSSASGRAGVVLGSTAGGGALRSVNGNIIVSGTALNTGYSGLSVGTDGAGGAYSTSIVSTGTGTITLNGTGAGGAAGILLKSTIAGNTLQTNNQTISLNGTVNLAQSTNITTGPGAGNINFNSAINGAQNLILSAGTGQINFGGAVGDSTALTGLYLTAGGTVNNANQVRASNLLLQGGANYTFSNTTNDFTTLAANLTGSGALNIVSSNVSTLTIGSVGGTSGLTTNTGSISVTSNKFITATSMNITSAGGNISLITNGLSGSGSQGIFLQGTNITAGGGNILLQGQGTAGGGNAEGIRTNGAVNIGTIGSGSITLIGTGAASSNGTGLSLDTANITTVNGNITLQGLGAAAPGADGINLNNGLIASSGSGSIAMTGTGGVATSVGRGIVWSGTILQANAGSISLVGTGGAGSATYQQGIQTVGGSATAASGNILFQGQATAGNAEGLYLGLSSTATSLATTGGGTITLIGTGSGSGVGLQIDSTAATVLSTANSSITINASVNLTQATNITTGAGLGNITFNNTINGAQNLTLAAGTGSINFGGAVGDSTALSGLYLTAGGTVNNANQVRANNLLLQGGANYTFSNTTNDFVTVAANLVGSGALNLQDAAGGNLTIGTVNVTNGITTAGGSVAINSNSTASAVNVAQAITTNGGNLTVYGQGTAATPAGIVVNAASMNTSGGTIALTGTGYGVSAGSTPNGVLLNNATLSSGAGNIALIGSGGIYTGNGVAGLSITNSSLTATGAGAISLLGTGGNSSAWGNGGIDVRETSNFTTVDGNITMNGLAQGTSGSAHVGITLFGNTGTVTVATSGNGSISLTGTGIPLGGGPPLADINLYKTVISTANANASISLTGLGGQGFILNNATIGNATVASNIALSATTMDWQVGTLIQGTGNLAVTGSSNSNTIGLGTGAGTLSLDNTELSLIQNGFANVTIGSGTQTGTINIAGNITAQDSMTFQTTGLLNIQDNITATGANTTLTFAAPTILTGNTNVTSAGGLITFTNALDGGYDLNLNAGTGQAALIGTVGGSTALNNLTANGGGNWDLGQNVTVTNNLNVSTSSGNLTASTGLITAGSVNLGATTGINLNNLASGNISATTTGGNLTLVNNTALPTNLTNLAATNGTISFTQLGSGNLTVVGNVTANGNIDVLSSNMITIGGGANVTSGSGGMGTVNLGGAIQLGNVTAGTNTTITFGGVSSDTIITLANISANAINITATRDIIVQNTVQSNASISLISDSDNDGVGGVWVQGGGYLEADQDIMLVGSDIFATPNEVDAIRIDGDGASVQLKAINGNITLTDTYSASGSQIYLGGVLEAANGSININNTVVLTGSTSVTANEFTVLGEVLGNQDLTVQLNYNPLYQLGGRWELNQLTLNQVAGAYLYNLENQIQGLNLDGHGGLIVSNKGDLAVSGTWNNASGGFDDPIAIVTTGDLKLTAGTKLVSYDSGEITLVTEARFINEAGSGALQAGSNGRWLVYSPDFDQDERGGLTGEEASGLPYPFTPQFDGNGFVATGGGSLSALNGILNDLLVAADASNQDGISPDDNNSFDPVSFISGDSSSNSAGDDGEIKPGETMVMNEDGTLSPGTPPESLEKSTSAESRETLSDAIGEEGGANPTGTGEDGALGPVQEVELGVTVSFDGGASGPPPANVQNSLNESMGGEAEASMSETMNAEGEPAAGGGTDGAGGDGALGPVQDVPMDVAVSFDGGSSGPPPAAVQGSLTQSMGNDVQQSLGNMLR